jgi:hypothetical protein
VAPALRAVRSSTVGNSTEVFPLLGLQNVPPVASIKHSVVRPAPARRAWASVALASEKKTYAGPLAAQATVGTRRKRGRNLSVAGRRTPPPLAGRCLVVRTARCSDQNQATRSPLAMRRLAFPNGPVRLRSSGTPGPRRPRGLTRIVACLRLLLSIYCSAWVGVVSANGSCSTVRTPRFESACEWRHEALSTVWRTDGVQRTLPVRPWDDARLGLRERRVPRQAIPGAAC